jgi:hypothetical protein
VARIDTPEEMNYYRRRDAVRTANGRRTISLGHA